MYSLNNGNAFPLIGLGTYLVKGTDTIKNVLDVGLAAGYRSFDTAAVYKNEEDIGRALLDLLPKYNLTRSDIFITTKLSPSDHGRGKARNAALKSLKKLQLSYIDLYLIHWPGVEGVDVKSDLNKKLRRESWFDLVDLCKEKVIHNIGVSNYTVTHLKELLKDCAGIRPVINQVEYHPMQKQVELVEFCKKENILIQAYSSLGGPRNTHILMSNSVVNKIAQKINKTTAQVLLKWAVQHGAAIIPRSVTPERIKNNITLNFELSPEDMKLLDSIDRVQKFSWEPAVVV